MFEGITGYFRRLTGSDASAAPAPLPAAPTAGMGQLAGRRRRHKTRRGGRRHRRHTRRHV